MKLSWCTLMINDMEESLTFYQDVLDLKIQRRFNPAPNVEICFLGETEQADGQTLVELICNKHLAEQLKQIPQRGAGINLGFEVSSSLDETMSMLAEKNINILRGPIQPSPQIRFLFISDPSGYEIQLAEHL